MRAATIVLCMIASQVRSAPLLAVFTSCAVLLITVRLWTSIQNKRGQNNKDTSEKDVPILPYWLPYLGNFPSFAWSMDDVVTRGRDRTHDGIFGLHMMGSTHNFVLMPSLARQIFLQRPAVLTSDDFIHWIHDKYFGDKGAARNLGKDDWNTVHHSLSSLMKEPFLSTATNRTAELIEERTPQLFTLSAKSANQPEWERYSNVAALESSAVEVDLYTLTMNFIGDIAGTALMGHAFLDNNPGIMQDLWTFDSGFGALLTGIPVITRGLKKATKARARINAAVDEWNHALMDNIDGKEIKGKWRDLSDVSETMRIRTRALQKIDSNDLFNIASNVAVYWGLMVNANKVIFWMLLHIISNSELLDIVRSEIKPFTGSDQGKLKFDVDGLIKSCLTFKGCFFESMRLYTSGVSYKKVSQDLTLTEGKEDATIFGKLQPQTYHIKKGEFLVIPQAALQTDPRLWDNPSAFKPERFLVPDEKDPKKMKADSLHLFAFGGGHSVCKGRYFAEREVLLFVAGFLSVWDFAPVDGNWSIPKKWYSGTGSANPKSNVRVRMTKRWARVAA